MKKILSVILILICLPLAACAPARGALCELAGFDGDYIVSADFSGDDIVLLGTDGDGYKLYLASVKNARVYRSAALDCDGFDGFSGAEFDADGNITVFLDYEGKCAVFDRELSQIGGEKPYESRDLTEKAKESAFFDGTMSAYESCFHYFNDRDHYELINAVGFYGDDFITLVKDERFNIISGCGKRILTSYPKDGSLTTDTVAVYDFESGSIVNSFVTENPDGQPSVSVTFGKLADNAAIIGVEYGDGDPAGGVYYNKYYIWDYENGAGNEPFEFTRYTADQMKAETDGVCGKIKDEFGIDVHIDEENPYQDAEDEEYGYTFGTSPLKAKVSVGLLYDFLKMLPDGFARETYSGFNEAVTGFDVYFVDGINGSPNAYANVYGDRYYVCFEAYSLDPHTVYHEFMHVMDARISAQGDFEEAWNALNPPDFTYLVYGEEEYDIEEYSDYFATAYSMQSIGEDRADMFAELFTAGLSGEPPYWYREGAATEKKAKLLSEQIRAAFPSMKDAPPQPWEIIG